MTDTPESRNLAACRAYLAALERFESVADLFHPEAVQVEFPNRLNPNGQRRGVEVITADSQRGARVLRSQTYDVVSAIAEGDRVALEVLWTAVLAMPVGDLKAGDTMTCHSGIFITFRDGKIWRQQNYDCFPPF